MYSRIRFKRNHKAFQQVILYNSTLGDILASKLGDGAKISKSSNKRGGGRIRARYYGKMEDEIADGKVSRKLGS